MDKVLVKICGLSTPQTLQATIAAGADMAGFVFFQKSPRHISLEAARSLGALAAGRIKKVALTVDASNAELEAIVAALEPDLLQLHGGEPPGRVADVKRRFELPIIKAIGVADAHDVLAAKAFEDVADILLFDAKPPPDAAAPGGAGASFDWSLLGDIGRTNWMLSGGLDPSNVARAIERTHAPGVDVSSGVECARGVKDEGRIKDFIAAAHALSSKERTV